MAKTISCCLGRGQEYEAIRNVAEDVIGTFLHGSLVEAYRLRISLPWRRCACKHGVPVTETSDCQSLYESFRLHRWLLGRDSSLTEMVWLSLGGSASVRIHQLRHPGLNDGLSLEHEPIRVALLGS